MITYIMIYIHMHNKKKIFYRLVGHFAENIPRQQQTLHQVSLWSHSLPGRRLPDTNLCEQELMRDPLC